MSSSSFSCFNLPSYTFFPLLPLSLSLLLPVRTSVYYIHSTCIPLTGHKKPWPWPSIRPSLHPLHYSAGLKYIVFFPNSFASRCAYGIKWMGWDLILIYLPPSSHRNCNERAKVDAASSRTLFLLEHPSQATRLNGGCYWTLLPDGWSTPIQSKTFQFFLSIFLFFINYFVAQEMTGYWKSYIGRQQQLTMLPDCKPSILSTTDLSTSTFLN